MKTMLRRLAARILLAGIAAGIATVGHAEDKVFRVGFQKYGTLVLLKSQGLLEEKLKPLGYTVEWTEFPAGPQLLEALNVGAIDFGTTGEAPPIFAQAAGAPLVYVGYEPPAPKGEAILVPKDSPLRTVADLKGRNVALITCLAAEVLHAGVGVVVLAPDRAQDGAGMGALLPAG
jgi:sulfonate transport system substrate-binding protein